VPSPVLHSDAEVGLWVHGTRVERDLPF